ncbi:MAG: glycerol-3-phosphate dehydrogenase/oxidase, partial [Isosphaeraceae bacterium]
MGSLSRLENLDRLKSHETWDIVVIGGGATGLGTAVDAASRGYRTVLLEARDFAHGTSSRSTKLIHGGVRYLAQGNLPLVREALRERGLLIQNAPHLVHARDFLVPAYQYWQLPYYGAGLWLYDRLAGKLGLGHSRWISRAETVARVPTIHSAGLKGSILYTDGQFDDARLAIALARTLADLGGLALNHMPVTRLIKREGRITGVEGRDEETGASLEVPARAVVNATGVFADTVRRMDDPGVTPMIAPSQGAHLVLDRSFLPGTTALMVPRTDDGRVLFAIPWLDRVLLGTTDTSMAVVPAEPRPLSMEIDFLLDHARRYLDRAPGRGDIKSLFAGLRPLYRPEGAEGTTTAKLSREHAVFVSQSGLVTVTGGKWTTYRTMARDAVDHAARVAGLPGRPCETATLKLHGGDQWAVGSGERLVGSAVRTEPEPRLIHQTPDYYGSDLSAVLDLSRKHPDWALPLHPSLPYTPADVVWGARHEAARTVEDVLCRRTRTLFLDARAAMEIAPRVAELLAAE